MIIELPGLKSNENIGYVKRYKMGFFHFSNNNLSLRKGCAKEVGMYDVKAMKSEDVDICFRIAQNPKWAAFREKGNHVKHKARRTFSAFIKQMWGWGFHVGYPYSKTGIKGIYLYWVDSKDHQIGWAIEIERFPFLACMFITDFHLMHLLSGVAILAGVMGASLLSAVAGVLLMPVTWRYLHDDREAGLSFLKTCQLAFTHYLANLVFSVATLLGALKQGILLVPANIFRPEASQQPYRNSFFSK